jgi:hypothetical protein
MKRVFTLCSLVILSLFIISADKFTCYNTDLIGLTDVNDPYKDTYIQYFAIDTNQPVFLTNYGDLYIYSITSDMKTGEKIIKDKSKMVGYSEFDEETKDFYAWTSSYIVFNQQYFLNGASSNDKARLEEWLGNPEKPSDVEVFGEPVLLYAYVAALGEDSADPNYFFGPLITKAFYMLLKNDDNNSSRLILEAEDLPLYEYEAILQGDADPLTTINFKNTVEIKKQIPNAK